MLVGRALKLSSYFSPNTSKVKNITLSLSFHQKQVLNLGRLSLFIWETTLGNRRIPDQSTEPYPEANGEQTRHAKGPVRLCPLLVTFISNCYVFKSPLCKSTSRK